MFPAVGRKTFAIVGSRQYVAHEYSDDHLAGHAPEYRRPQRPGLIKSFWKGLKKLSGFPVLPHARPSSCVGQTVDAVHLAVCPSERQHYSRLAARLAVPCAPPIKVVSPSPLSNSIRSARLSSSAPPSRWACQTPWRPPQRRAHILRVRRPVYTNPVRPPFSPRSPPPPPISASNDDDAKFAAATEW